MGLSIFARDKSVRLTVTIPGGKKIVTENMRGDEGFRMGFTAKRTMDDSPGEFEVEAYNLPSEILGALDAAQARKIDDIDALLSGQTLQVSAVAPDSSDALAAGLLIVTLEAGYDGEVSQVYSAVGASTHTRSTDGNTTTVTTIKAVENLDGALLGLPMATFPAGSTLFELVDYLRRIAGLAPGNFSYTALAAILGAGGSTLSTPYHVSGGEALAHLRNVLQFLPMRWFIDDRALWICGREGVPNTGLVPPWVVDQIEEPLPLLAPPQRDDVGRVVAECFLCTRLKVGRLVRLTAGGMALSMQGLSPTLVQIQSAKVPPGLYRLDEVTHSGDTGDGDFTTRMLLRTAVGVA